MNQDNLLSQHTPVTSLHLNPITVRTNSKSHGCCSCRYHGNPAVSASLDRILKKSHPWYFIIVHTHTYIHICCLGKHNTHPDTRMQTDSHNGGVRRLFRRSPEWPWTELQLSGPSPSPCHCQTPWWPHITAWLLTIHLSFWVTARAGGWGGWCVCLCCCWRKRVVYGLNSVNVVINEYVNI